ncbi:glycosyltransferase family 4 protein [Pelomonas sp. V22]|uniref:MraY family glycosyltransferase n=1 Tax=Pelomonas sp. V22 TaxID=2822139 RepID=UPI0024A9F850|nr:glycosyltransferase [Pelomonas sp. V22]MDI4632496.1 glycosyltransferase family 4 protein [Pelomonas sp. V22]
MLNVLFPFLVAAVVTLLVVRSARSHGRFSADADLSGPQKFHARPVPRVGGIGILLGMLACAVYMWLTAAPEQAWFGLGLALCGLPAFAMGLTEDLTKSVSPAKRLLATGLSAGLAAWFLGAQITRTDLPGLDWLVGFVPGAILITVFVIAGVANAFNIIDGFNGLSSMCAVLILLAIALVAHDAGDAVLAAWALAGVGAILGFFVWNFPAGLIFLGDGGAYFVGFLVAELAVLLIHRQQQLSPLFALMVCIYPVFETVFSIYRRRFIRAVPPGLPDGIHLHSLVYRRAVRWAVGARDAKLVTRRNSLTAPYLWMLCIASLVPAVLFRHSTPLLAACILLFGCVYVAIYWRIVRFRTPRWLVLSPVVGRRRALKRRRTRPEGP